MAWPELLGAAVNAMKIAPSEFWGMTLPEFRAISDAFVAKAGMSKSDKAELYRVGQEAIAKEAGETNG